MPDTTLKAEEAAGATERLAESGVPLYVMPGNDDDFSIDVPIEARAGASPEPIVLETDQIYVPAERSRRTQDRRHLGLRIFKCELR